MREIARRRIHRLLPLAALAGALALGGCAEGYGYGGAYPDSAYYGGGYDYGPYGYGPYDGWYGDGGWGYPGYGWYDGFYYPGSGIYIYDRGGHRREWHGQRWPGDGGGWRGHSGTGWHGAPSGQAGAHHFGGAFGGLSAPHGNHGGHHGR